MNSKYYPWILVGLLWVVALLNYMDRQILATMRPAMQMDISELQSATSFGYLMAIFLWIYGFMSPVSGIIADKFSRKWLIIGSLFVWSGVTFAMGYATTFNQLYVLRAIMGVSEALYIPAGLSLIADFHSTKTRSLAIGIHMTGLYMGQALGGFGAQTVDVAPPDQAAPVAVLADANQVGGMLAHLEQALVALEFLDPEAPKKLMPRMNQLFNRAGVTQEEIHILRGISKSVLQLAARNAAPALKV